MLHCIALHFSGSGPLRQCSRLSSDDENETFAQGASHAGDSILLALAAPSRSSKHRLYHPPHHLSDMLQIFQPDRSLDK
ncbi:hypothetical protein EYC84_007560 [Monilinia fructicola]|uniref:Uncharacterized protein n=1 Tax=Monilinia fructicola TaxID=38448 RepID=A0A5M9JIR3_MONFR|nr:hypothetical protein EYC84_007560 [Monilinia fructicola]